MIDFLSSWVKNLGLAIVIVSILEMLLPNNKTKKYIKIVMGIFVIFNIISPFIKQKEVFSIENFDIDGYSNNVNNNEIVNQESMDRRIEELYKEELENDITKKLEDKGYSIKTCKVDVTIGNEENTKINKIKLDLEKKNEENTDKNKNKENQNEKIENKIVEEIQKIKPIETKVEIETDENKDNKNDNEETTDITKEEIQNIQNFLIEEYGVTKECLEIK